MQWGISGRTRALPPLVARALPVTAARTCEQELRVGVPQVVLHGEDDRAAGPREDGAAAGGAPGEDREGANGVDHDVEAPHVLVQDLH